MGRLIVIKKQLNIFLVIFLLFICCSFLFSYWTNERLKNELDMPTLNRFISIKDGMSLNTE